MSLLTYVTDLWTFLVAFLFWCGCRDFASIHQRFKGKWSLKHLHKYTVCLHCKRCSFEGAFLWWWFSFRLAQWRFLNIINSLAFFLISQCSYLITLSSFQLMKSCYPVTMSLWGLYSLSMEVFWRGQHGKGKLTRKWLCVQNKISIYLPY